MRIKLSDVPYEQFVAFIKQYDDMFKKLRTSPQKISDAEYVDYRFGSVLLEKVYVNRFDVRFGDKFHRVDENVFPETVDLVIEFWS
jgi:hypothetical protein